VDPVICELHKVHKNCFFFDSDFWCIKNEFFVRRYCNSLSFRFMRNLQVLKIKEMLSQAGLWIVYADPICAAITT